MMGRLIEMLAGWLDSAEREAVLGDLVESGKTNGQALRDMIGLVARRQAVAWHDPVPWLFLLGVVIPIGLLICMVAGPVDDDVWSWSAGPGSAV